MSLVKPDRLKRGSSYTYIRKRSWIGVHGSGSGSNIKTLIVTLLEIKGQRVRVRMPPNDAFTTGCDTWIDRDELREDVTIEAPTNALAIRPIDKGRGKREAWHPRWAVVETISGECLAVGRYTYKATAEKALRGANKSGDRLVRAALDKSSPAHARALRVLKRYFTAHRRSEGFGT